MVEGIEPISGERPRQFRRKTRRRAKGSIVEKFLIQVLEEGRLLEERGCYTMILVSFSTLQ